MELMNKKTYIYSGIVAAVIFGLTAYALKLSSAKQVNAADTDDEKAKVVIQVLKPADDKLQIVVPAKVEAKTQSTVQSNIDAHVVSLNKSIGSTVKKGDIVLFLENKEPGFTYAKVPIRSPISGNISQIMVAEMTKVARGDKLFSVVDPSTMKIFAEFGTKDLPYLKIGTAGKFKSLNSNTADINVNVKGISPLVDPRTGTAAAELEFTDGVKDNGMLGTIGQVVIEVTLGQVMLIPETALSYSEGKPLVKIANEKNQIERKMIELGPQRDDLYVIKSGVIAGDKVVVRSSRNIRDGDTVEIQSEGKN